MKTTNTLTKLLVIANLACAAIMVSQQSYGIAVFNFGVFLILLKEV